MRVLIVDDHPLFRDGMETLLRCLDADLDAVGVSSAREAVKVAGESADFDLVLLDMNMPGFSHMEALAQVNQACEHASVVIVSAEDDPVLIHRSIEAGAVGFIPKTTDPSVIINALRLVMAHGVYLPPGALVSGLSGVISEGGVSPPAMPMLSERQRDVLRYLLQGKSNKLIAREMHLAEGTVKAHLWAAYQLLGVSTRVQAMYRVYELGMLASLSGTREPER